MPTKSVTLPAINGGSTAGVLTTDASGNVTVGAKTTDANGWTVYNYGAWKEYIKRVTTATSGVSLASLKTHLAPEAKNMALPVGITNINSVSGWSVQIISGISDWAATYNISSGDTIAGNVPAVNIRNVHDSTLTFQNIVIQYRIIN